jgi:excisionase family DNA binding protein
MGWIDSLKRLNSPPKKSAKLATAKQAAEYLGITERHIHRLVRQGRLQCVQISTKVRKFSIDQLKAFIEASKTPTPKKQIDKKLSDGLTCIQGNRENKPFDRQAAKGELRSWRSK